MAPSPVSVGVGSGGGGCLGLRWRARYLPSSQLRIAANSASSGVSHHLSSFVSLWSINNGSARMRLRRRRLQLDRRLAWP